MIVSEKIRERAQLIDPDCWLSYSGQSVHIKRRIEARRNLALDLARKELAGERDESYPDKGLRTKTTEHTVGSVSEKITEEFGARYSVQDIERMRTAIRGNPALTGRVRSHGYSGSDSGALIYLAEKHVEELLRTYMTNGTTPAELEAARELEWKHIEAKTVTRKAMRAVAEDRNSKGGDNLDFICGDTLKEMSVAAANEIAAGLPLDGSLLSVIKSRVKNLAIRLARY